LGKINRASPLLGLFRLDKTFCVEEISINQTGKDHSQPKVQVFIGHRFIAGWNRHWHQLIHDLRRDAIPDPVKQFGFLQPS
jgi:hypothetical protein